LIATKHVNDSQVAHQPERGHNRVHEAEQRGQRRREGAEHLVLEGFNKLVNKVVGLFFCAVRFEVNHDELVVSTPDPLVEEIVQVVIGFIQVLVEARFAILKSSTHLKENVVYSEFFILDFSRNYVRCKIIIIKHTVQKTTEPCLF
jgi:hypothetical protein